MKRNVILLGLPILLIIVLLTLTGCGNQKAEDNQNMNVSSEETANSNSNNEDVNTEKFEKVTEVGDLNLIINETGKYFLNERVPVIKNGKIGFIDKKGNLVIDYQFDKTLTQFDNTLSWEYKSPQELIPVEKNQKWGYIDKNGNVVIDFQYTWATNFSEGLAQVRINDGENFCYIDTSGNIVIDTRNSNSNTGSASYFAFSNGLFPVSNNFTTTKWGYIDKTGKLVIDYQYENTPSNFSDGLACVKKENKWGFIDTNGNVVVDFKYDNSNICHGKFSEGYANLQKEGKNIYVSKEKELLKYEASQLGEFSNNLAPAKNNENKYGYIDTEENVMINFNYNWAKNFSEGLAPVQKNGKFGFIDTKGNIIIDFQYDDAWEFSEGLACVKKDGKYGFINYDGTVIIGNIQLESQANKQEEGILVGGELLKFGVYEGKDASDNTTYTLKVNSDHTYEINLPWIDGTHKGDITIAYDDVYQEEHVVFGEDYWGIVNSNGSILSQTTIDFHYKN